jgi:hypothetical protein
MKKFKWLFISENFASTLLLPSKSGPARIEYFLIAGLKYNITIVEMFEPLPICVTYTVFE